MKYWYPPPPRLKLMNADEIEIRQIEQLFRKLINVDELEIREIVELKN